MTDEHSYTYICFFDPLVPYLKLDGLDIKGIALTPAVIRRFDMVVVAVDHSAVNYNLIYKNARLIFDIRNVYKKPTDQKVIKL